jgi:lysine 6-dehydrogenase
MKILIIGSGLMGPAAAFNALSDPQVERVVLCDRDPRQLAAARAKLAALGHAGKLHTTQLDLSAQDAAVALMRESDAIVAALPPAVVPLGVRAAMEAGTPWIDLSWAPPDQASALRERADAAGALVLFGCGVEPGLTEIMARHLAEKLDRVDEVHIKCGGIPTRPTPPLGYKIVFGGRHLPLRESDAHVVEAGQLRLVPRYSGVETFTVEGVGRVEAWHEGFMPWLLELDALRGLRVGTQKTVRWPGYAEKAALLRELGLLSEAPVDVDGVRVAPKHVVDALLYPQVKMTPDDRDLTVFRVDATGEKAGRSRRYRVEMVDRYDETLGFTSMARVTAFTGAIIARMAARGEIDATGVITPERVITGALLDRLVAELADAGVHFDLTEEKEETLGV